MDRWVGGSSKLWLLDMFWWVHWTPEAAATLSSLLFSFCTGRQGTFLSWGGGLALHGLHPQLHTWPAPQESPQKQPKKRYVRDVGRSVRNKDQFSPKLTNVASPVNSPDDHCNTLSTSPLFVRGWLLVLPVVSTVCLPAYKFSFWSPFSAAQNRDFIP